MTSDDNAENLRRSWTRADAQVLPDALLVGEHLQRRRRRDGTPRAYAPQNGRALPIIFICQESRTAPARPLQYSSDDATVEVRVSASGSGIAIEVEDHGPGIPPEELPSLFKAYTRLSTVNLTKQRSAGLGLAITRRMVEAHGGTIDVRSEVGKGSLFVLRLR